MKKIFDQPVLKVVHMHNSIIVTSPTWSDTQKNASEALMEGRGGWDEEEW